MKTPGYYLAKVLPPSKREWLVRRAFLRRYRSAVLSYPLNLERVHHVLFVVPEDPLEALYQVENIMALRARFAAASVTFLGGAETSAYLREILGEGSYIDYSVDERYLHSPAFEAFGISLAHEHFDACFLLEKRPDLALLDIVGRTGAGVRVGYDGAGDFPFFNHLVKPSPRHKFLTDRNCAMARSLGASPSSAPRVVVPREAIQGIAHLLRDLGVKEDAPVAVLDACEFVRRHGREWTAGLIEELRRAAPVTYCCFSPAARDDQFAQWLTARHIVAVPALSIPRQAAFLKHAAFVVTGKAVALRLSALLDVPSVAALTVDEATAFVGEGTVCAAVTFAGEPDLQTAASVADHAARIIARLARSMPR